MKFNRINDNKIQIILSKEDMLKHNISKSEFTPYSPDAQKIFGEILEQAYVECGFEIGRNAQLMIEAFPITGESLLITVTKIGDAKQIGSNPLDILGLSKTVLNSLIGEEEDEKSDFPKLTTGDAVYRFVNLEHVIEAVQVSGGNYDSDVADSQLYRYQDNYYLLFSDKSRLSQSMLSVLDEYADRMDVVSQFYREHGQVAMEHQAVTILMKL